MLGSVERIVVARTWTSCDAFEQHRLKNFGFWHLDLQLLGSSWSPVRFGSVLPKAVLGVAYAAVDLDESIGVVVDVTPEPVNTSGRLPRR